MPESLLYLLLTEEVLVAVVVAPTVRADMQREADETGRVEWDDAD